MALTANFSIERTEIATLLGTAQTRGIVVDGFQSELVRITKLTGDTTGSFDLESINRPVKVLSIPITDAGGSLLTTQPTLTSEAFTHTDDNTIAVSALGNWTAAYFLVLGRSFKYA